MYPGAWGYRPAHHHRSALLGHRRQRRQAHRPQTHSCVAPWDHSTAQPGGSWIYGPEHHEPDRDEVENLRDRKAMPLRPSSNLEIDEAFSLADQDVANFRITHASCLDVKRRRSYRPEFLPLMVFNELDKMLFCSVLKGNVYLTLARLPPGVNARTCRPGLHGRPRITIELSNSIFRNGTAYVLGMLLHQMIHAYYLQCCGFRNDRVKSTGHNLRHGAEFEALRETIRKRFLPGENDLWKAEKHAKQPVPRHRQVFSPGTSSCFCVGEVIKNSTVEMWRKAAEATAISKRAVRKAEEAESRFNRLLADNTIRQMQAPIQQYPFRENPYFELRFEGKITAIPRLGNPYLDDLAKSPYFENGGLAFPAVFSYEDFEILRQFLTHREYYPTLSQTLEKTATETTITSLLSTYSSNGTPYIAPASSTPAPPPFLLKSVDAVNLAIHLNFKPLVRHAVQRMKSLPFTLENPIPILEHIYLPKTLSQPSSDIRQWTREWLSLQLPTKFKEHAWTYGTNLGVLEKQQAYAPRLKKLKERSTTLADDVAYVQQYAPASRGPQESEISTERLLDEGGPASPQYDTYGSYIGTRDYFSSQNPSTSLPRWEGTPPPVNSADVERLTGQFGEWRLSP